MGSMIAFKKKSWGIKANRKPWTIRKENIKWQTSIWKPRCVRYLFKKIICFHNAKRISSHRTSRQLKHVTNKNISKTISKVTKKKFLSIGLNNLKWFTKFNEGFTSDWNRQKKLHTGRHTIWNQLDLILKRRIIYNSNKS